MMSKSILGISYVPPEKETAVQDLVEKGISADEKIRFFDIKYDDKRIDLSKDYLEKIKKIPQKNLKVELAHKLLDDAIKARFKRNIIKQKSFQERIETTLSKYHGKFESDETVMARLEEVAKDITQEKKREDELKLSDEEIAFYDIVAKGKEFVESDHILKEIATSLTDYLKKNTKIDWVNQDNVKAEIRMGVRKILIKANFPFDKIEDFVPSIMEQAEQNYGLL